MKWNVEEGEFKSGRSSSLKRLSRQKNNFCDDSLCKYMDTGSNGYLIHSEKEDKMQN